MATQNGFEISKMSLSRCPVATPLILSLVKLLIPNGARACLHSGAEVINAKCDTRPTAVNSCARSMYIVEERGSQYAHDYRVYFKDEKGPLSPFHDIPLWVDRATRVANMVVEVPRWSNAKMEVSRTEPLNPILQDVKKGVLRFVANVFPHHGYIWNYGMLPQTWENPHHVDPSTQCRGDNDPIDVIEIGQRVALRGDVIQVKILGVLALVDEGETDWKLVAIDTRDPAATKMSDIADVEANFPGLMRATVEWFKLYKVPDGKPPNQFAFNGEAKNAEFAIKVIDETHEFWREMVNGDRPDTADINKMNVSVDSSPHRVDRSDAAGVVAAQPQRFPPQAIPSSVDKWHFVSNI